MSFFKNKVAVVTGGAGGIGGAIIEELARSGAHAVAFDVNAQSIESAIQGWSAAGLNVTCMQVDVTDFAQVQRSMAAVHDTFGRLDFLVNVAGGRGRTKGSTIAKTSADDWSHVIDLNLAGPFHCIKAAAEHMREGGGGAIVTVGALAGLTMSLSNSAAYTSAKAAILGLTRHSAYELARDNIRVNAVLPGPVMTPQIQARATPDMLSSVSDTVPLGRWLSVSEVAAPVLFFLSEASAACMGTYLVVDGGMHIGNPTTPAEYFKIRGES